MAIVWKHFTTEAGARTGQLALKKKYKVVTKVFKCEHRSGYDVGYYSKTKKK